MEATDRAVVPELKPGDRIKDNDPRVSFNRILEVVEILPNGATVLDGNGRRFRLLRNRIFLDSKPRRTGFSRLIERD